MDISAQKNILFGGLCFQFTLLTINFYFIYHHELVDPGTPVSSTNKADHHDITEILFENGVKHHKPHL
jgi:hypothetical protein